MDLGLVINAIASKLLGYKVKSVDKFLTKTLPSYSEDVKLLVFDCIVAFSERTELPTSKELANLFVAVKNNGDNYIEKGQYGMATDLQDLLCDDPEAIVEAAKRIVGNATVHVDALIEIAIDKRNFNTWTRRMAIWCLGFMEHDHKETLQYIADDETDDFECRDHAKEAIGPKCARIANNHD